jgi:O-antigen/teichoic acid export membrane protein
VRLFASAIEGSFFLLFPLVLGVILLAPELLRIWVGPEFAKNSSAVTRVLAVGVLINGVAHIPFVLVQGAGRPDLTGKLHLVELPLYVGLLWWLTAAYGLLGAAMAWTGRVTVDAVVLFAAALRLLGSTRDLLGQIGKLAVISVGFGAAALLVSGWFAKSAYLVFAVLGFLAVFWRYVLEDEARLVLRTLWARRCGRA